MRPLLAVLAALLFASAPDAQVRQGLVELGGSASFLSYDGTTVLQFSPAVGYFFTDALEAGARLNYQKIEGFDGSGSISLFGAYHFGGPGATTVPFLEANLGVDLTGDSDLLFGGRGGAKFFFLPGGALTAAALVQTTGDFTIVGAEAGVSIFF